MIAPVLSCDALGPKAQMNVVDVGVFTYSYDENNRLSVVQNPQGDRTTLSYDDAGRRTLKELANGTKATYLYDSANRTLRVANLKSNDDTISQFDYTYDAVGNKKTIATAAGGLTTYSYDATYRLTEEHRTTDSLSWSSMSANDWGDLSVGGWGTLSSGGINYRNTFAYDPTGNRTLGIRDGARTTSTFDAANQNVYSESTAGRTTYTFDASGNRTVVEKPDNSRTTTTYDYENRDIVIQLPTSIMNTMQYNPDGLRCRYHSKNVAPVVEGNFREECSAQMFTCCHLFRLGGRWAGRSECWRRGTVCTQTWSNGRRFDKKF